MKHKIPAVTSFAAAIIVLAGVMYAERLITQILMALFITIVCLQPMRWLVKKKIPQALAVVIVLIGAIALFIGFGELITQSLSNFTDNMDEYEKNLMTMLDSFIRFLSDLGFKLSRDKIEEMYDPSKLMKLTGTLLGQLGGFMGNFMTIFFLTLFLLLEVDSVEAKADAIMKGSSQSIRYFHKIGDSIRHYLTIKTITSLLTGVSIWVALAIIGIDYAILWALIAFLLNYIPNIGSFIAAAPAVLFAIVQMGFSGFLWTSIVFVVVNIVVGSVLEPKIMGHGMGLSTFVVFLSLIFFGFFLGTVGMFLSVPLTMTIKIMLEQNTDTRWLAIILGTKREAEAILNNNDI